MDSGCLIKYSLARKLELKHEAILLGEEKIKEVARAEVEDVTCNSLKVIYCN